MLTFELSENAESVYVHFDKNGLLFLKNLLQELESKNENDHVHLLTPSWGGHDLTEEKQSNSSKLINDVKIHFWQ